ncbi:hypothetical protein PGT21_036628 [Puccinia graminis f. sp. tritici]|uniref:Uncharacterized protein n=1 Tax=Puccinia graminis f. sp. tritici TaxID=56615 RepID=A0A5B0P2Z0_PUCGR|nr:hypothetical protein PGT21_036628 [Puccinia graminis f. sp. tritici]
MHTLSSGETPPDERVGTPAHREESLPASWIVYQLAGRDSSRRRAGMNTLSSGGVSPDERVCTPLLASWIVYQLAGRDSSRRAGMNTLLSGGVSPDQRPTTQASTQAPPPMAMAIEPAARLTPALPAATRPNVTARPATEKVPLPPAIATYLQGIIPARREKPLPTRGYSSQLVGRNPSRRAGMYTSSSGGTPPGELDCVPARREGFLLAVLPLLAPGMDTRISARFGRKNSHPQPNPHPLAGIRWHWRVSASG